MEEEEEGEQVDGSDTLWPELILWIWTINVNIELQERLTKDIRICVLTMTTTSMDAQDRDGGWGDSLLYYIVTPFPGFAICY